MAFQLSVDSRECLNARPGHIEQTEKDFRDGLVLTPFLWKANLRFHRNYEFLIG